mgnify:CR=1 FL=1
MMPLIWTVAKSAKNSSVPKGISVRVILCASALPVEEGHVRLVRKWWRLGAEKLVEAFHINPVLSGVGHADNQARILRIGNETKFRQLANGLRRE